MSYQNVGVHNAGIFAPKSSGVPITGVPMMDAAGIASGGAFLVSELEKRDTMIRKPLTSVTYPRDIVIQTGGGWVEYASAMSVAYGITGGSGDGVIGAPGANGIPVVQASVDKGVYKTHIYASALRVMFVDMQRSNYIGRSLDSLLQDGVRLTYDKHMDQNTYTGFAQYGTTGLINNPNAVQSTVADGTAGNGNWATKTPQEILTDINTALSATWAAAEYDESALPNHILIPYEEYNYILTTMVTTLATETIMDFVMKNNVAAKRGTPLYIGATRWCSGAGAGGTDRMVVYVNHERFLKQEELVPLSRIMSAPNVTNVCYDTAYMANISEVEVMYPQTITYWDNIGGDT
jgi:putative bacteriophage protein